MITAHHLTFNLRLHLTWSLLCLMPACAPQELMTDPCLEGCNDDAVIGSACEVAEDCSTGAFCHLGYLEGYCQLDCTDLERGDACGPGDSGVCVVGNGQSICMASCANTQDNACNTGTACYTLDDGLSVCELSCAADSDCGAGFACDGAGRCQPAVATCDPFSHQGCPAGLNCYVSNATGYFCGKGGAGREGDTCNNVAGCEGDLWCVEAQCRPLCDVDNVYACQGVPAACLNVVSGSRAGVCTL